MANKHLFRRIFGSAQDRRPDVQNEAGAPAYQLSAEEALAQLAFTGCLNGTFYSEAEDQLVAVLELAEQVEAEFLARLAVAARERGFMKDMPALLCAILAVRDGELLERVFGRVIDNGRMLRNFVQIVRSGVTGRQSLGSRPRRLVRQWLNQRSDMALFRASVGNDPSLADILRMVHPRPGTPEREALYGYLLGKPHQSELLPRPVQQYRAFLAGETAEAPDVPFQFLVSQDLSTEAWATIARNAPWQMTRMNLATFQRHGLFEDRELVELLAARLGDAQQIRQARAFPYQIMTAYMNTRGQLPQVLSDALHQALEVATANVPALGAEEVVVGVDVSGSMHSPVTGRRRGATTSVSCLDVAALVAAVILRTNPEARVVPFSDRLNDVVLEPRDTVMTNAQILASLPSGGTDCSLPLRRVNQERWDSDLIVIVSDQESWIGHRYHGNTPLLEAFRQHQRRRPNAKLVCIDLCPYTTVQAPPGGDIFHIGGFSDQVFDLLSAIAAGRSSSWLDEIRAVAV